MTLTGVWLNVFLTALIVLVLTSLLRFSRYTYNNQLMVYVVRVLNKYYGFLGSTEAKNE